MRKRNPIVWVTQIPHHRDAITGMRVPRINISPAAAHGAVQVMLPPDVNFFATEGLISQMRTALQDYDHTAVDSVLALGDPAVCAVVGAILSEQSDAFVLLRWDRHIEQYVRVEIKLN